MNVVFLDTVGRLALWDQDDQWHAAAAAAFASLVSTKTRLVTTTFVLLECGNAAARRPSRLLVNALRQTLAARGEVLAPTDADLRAAWSAYDRGEANNAGIVDHVSFVIMRRLGLTQAFTNDRHDQAAGLEVLFSEVVSHPGMRNCPCSISGPPHLGRPVQYTHPRHHPRVLNIDHNTQGDAKDKNHALYKASGRATPPLTRLPNTDESSWSCDGLAVPGSKSTSKSEPSPGPCP